MSGLAYFSVIFLLFTLFVLIAMRTFSRRNRQRGEAPKYRMLRDEEEGVDVGED